MMVLAIESSTSSAKALLYKEGKGVVRSCQQSYGREIDQNGMTDTDAVYRLTMAMGRKAAEGYGDQIEAIALCGTWHSLAVCDRQLHPVMPTFSWNFTGTSEICDQIRKDEECTDWLYQTTGCMPHNTYPRHVLAWLQQQGHDLSDRLFITQGAYNFLQMTGEYLETVCTHSGTGILNLKKLTYDEGVLKYLGVREDQFAPLGTYLDTHPLNHEGAELLGLREGIPVVPAHADGALNQTGNYANRDGVMTLSIGTSGAIRLCSDHPVLPKGRELWCYYGIRQWITGAAIQGACNCINWYKETVLQNRCSFNELEQIDDTADVPVFLPFLFSERCPGWNAGRRGGFVGVSGEDTAATMYKAIQMGVLFNIYQCFETLCEERRKPDEIIVSGGIQNSEKWMQMAADILGQDILAANCPNASSMGAVALALTACGALDDVDSFRADYDSVRKIAADPTKKEYYRRHYTKYMEAYQGLRI